jgi:hypothetical protein
VDYLQLPEVNISDQLCEKNQTPDIIHLFAKSNKELENEMKRLKPLIKSNTSITI